MSKRRSARLGLGAVILVLAFAYWNLWGLCQAKTHGEFTYALDDPYIHLAIAKNLAERGVWGVTPYANTSACSSPLWVCMLAVIMKAVGANPITPLVLNVAFAVGAASLVYNRLVDRGVFVTLAAASTIGIFLGTSLLALPFAGMEHSLQILLVLCFGFWFVGLGPSKAENFDLAVAFCLGLLMTLCRYESWVLFVVPAIASAVRRDFRLASVLALAPVVAIVGFGLASRLAGMPFIPNSIALRSAATPRVFGTFVHFFCNRCLELLHLPPIFLLGSLWWVVVLAFVLVRWVCPRDGSANLQVWLGSLALTLIAQANVAPPDWFYRYEANLVASVSTFALYSLLTSRVGSSYKRLVGASVLQGACLLLLGGAIVPRGLAAYLDTPKACGDIFSQQRQMARFIGRFYPNGRVAANDIGCLTFFSDVHLLDLAGLSSDNICRLILAHNFTTSTLGSAMRSFSPDLVIAYPSWFLGKSRFPGWMVPVATWTIPKATWEGSNVVQFYATNAVGAVRLRREISEFSPSLPPQVTVAYVDIRGGRGAPAR